MIDNAISKNEVEETQFNDELLEIERWYQELQGAFPVSELDRELGKRLLNVQHNYEEPVLSWYVLKEAFSAELPLWVVNKLKDGFKAEISQVLDPFVGCGTTGIALSRQNIQVDGLEYNPFIRFVASTKAQSDKVNRDTVVEFIEKLEEYPPKAKKFKWPQLSTLHNPKYFRNSDIRYLLFVLNEIEENVTCIATKNFLRLGVARSLDMVSNLRKDGRALRFTNKTDRPKANKLLPDVWRKMLADLCKESLLRTEFKVYAGTAKDLSTVFIQDNNSNKAEVFKNDTYDLVIYSPPYLNNFDYSEIYKLELWMLGFISTYDEWRDLRKSTILSHHSLKVSLPVVEHLLALEAGYVSEWVEKLSNSTLLSGYSADNMPLVIRGYFNDMYISLKEQFRVLKPGGYLVYIVANSRHSRLPIATDLILGKLGQAVGFEPIELNVLKKRNGRTKQKNYLRESAVFMRKPA